MKAAIFVGLGVSLAAAGGLAAEMPDAKQGIEVAAGAPTPLAPTRFRRGRRLVSLRPSIHRGQCGGPTGPSPRRRFSIPIIRIGWSKHSATEFLANNRGRRWVTVSSNLTRWFPQVSDDRDA